MSVSPADTAYWQSLAKRVAKKIYKESKGDYYDVKMYRDSTGVYILYHSRWYVVTPSGYKVWYRTPKAIKLPRNTPEYFEKLVLKELDRSGDVKSRVGETLVAISGCGLAVVGGLLAVLFSLQQQ